MSHPPSSTRLRPARLVRAGTLLALLALAALACSPGPAPGSPGATGTAGEATGGPTASPTSPPGPTTEPTAIPESVFADLERQTSETRGLETLSDVGHALLTRDELAIKLREDFETDNPEAYVKGSEGLLKGLGLIPEDADLQAMYLRLLESQVAGFYRPDEDAMFVVADAGFGPVESVYYVHEYTHALQDQHFDPWRDADDWRDQGDLAIARASLTEGDATLLMTQWATQHLDADGMRQLLQAGSDPESLAALADLPPILTEPLLFPYTQGLTIVTEAFGSGGWAAVDALYDRPPESTEQVLHPEKFATHEPPIEIEAPPDLAARMGDGWSVALEDRLGELQLGIWLKTNRRASEFAAARTAAEGWGGDRAIYLTGPDGRWAVALLTQWDSPADADEFADQAIATREAIGRDGTVVHAPGSTEVRVLLGSDSATAIKLDSILGATGV